MTGENRILVIRFWQHEVMSRGGWSMCTKLNLVKSNEFGELLHNNMLEILMDYVFQNT